jgi:hypothetical protein
LRTRLSQGVLFDDVRRRVYSAVTATPPTSIRRSDLPI